MNAMLQLISIVFLMIQFTSLMYATERKIFNIPHCMELSFFGADNIIALIKGKENIEAWKLNVENGHREKIFTVTDNNANACYIATNQDKTKALISSPSGSMYLSQ